MRLARSGTAAAALVVAVLSAAPAGAQVIAPPPKVLLFLVSGPSFDGLLSMPLVRLVAEHGGAALLSHPNELAAQAGEINRVMELKSQGVLATWELVDLGTIPDYPCIRYSEGIPCYTPHLRYEHVNEAIAGAIEGRPGAPIRVIVASTAPSEVGRLQGDLVTGIVIGTVTAAEAANPTQPIDQLPPIRALTSDSTRRAGVVVGSDLAPTVGPLIGLTAANGLPTGGYPMRITNEPAPFALHQRYLAQRRMYVPVGIAAGIYVTVVGLIGIGLAAFRRRLPSWAPVAVATLVLTAIALFVALLEVGRLQTLDYLSATSFIVAWTVIGTVVAILVGRRLGPIAPLVIAGALALGVLIFESFTGWPSTLTPLLGGSALDGGRYYGMPNVEIGLMLGSAVFVARGIKPMLGTALLIACGLLAGFPWTWAGANLGASITLFAAAGIWFGLRTTGKVLTVRTIAATAVVTVAGTAVVLLTNRLWPGSPTHISDFLATQGRTAGGVLHKIWDRLAVGIHLIGRDPFALIPVLGVPVVLWFVVKTPGSLRDAFDACPHWRDALLTILLGSIVAYVANDSGAAALGLGFGTAIAGLLYVALKAPQLWPQPAVSEPRPAHIMEST